MVKIQCSYDGDVNWFIEQLAELGAEDIEEIRDEA